MAETSANWVEHVLPSSAPLRQWVLTLPFELRARVAYDRELCSRATRLFADSVLGFYRRTMRDVYRVGKGKSGAVTVVQHFLERRGVIERVPDPRLADDGFAEREPELAALATAAVTGNPPSGPEHRQRPAIVLPEHGERFVSALSAREDGFSVHAATTAPADDARARETLCPPSGITERVKYVLRPPHAQDRVRWLAPGRTGTLSDGGRGPRPPR